MDLNVRVIKAVECCPLLYKGNASIEERQQVWQQLSEQMQVSETVLKSRWHLLCSYYQRYLEKRRSTDENEDGESQNSGANNFKYEKEMGFMTSYMHARIAIAAANAARKQQEMASAAAGTKELTDPEFVITEKDLENAKRMSNNLNEEYMFYDVDTLYTEEHHHQQHQQQQQEQLEREQEDKQHHHHHHHHHQHQHDSQNNMQAFDYSQEIIDGEEQQFEVVEEIPEDVSEVIEEIDDSNGIVVQDIIIESGNVLGEDGEEIIVKEEGDIIQMDDEQIEVQNETVIEETVEEELPTEDIDVKHHHLYHQQQQHSHQQREEQQSSTAIIRNIQSNALSRIIRIDSEGFGKKFAKIIQEPQQQHHHHQQQQQQQHHHSHQQQQSTTTSASQPFTQEYALMTRRRRAVVLKATPRVQVELTDNTSVASISAVAANALHAMHQEQEDSLNHETITTTTTTTMTTPHVLIQRSHSKRLNSNQSNDEDSNAHHEGYCNNLHNGNNEEDNRSIAESNEEEDTSKGERSEDTIFGELVSAMLKHMPAERKRSIKKSIMDLLLT